MAASAANQALDSQARRRDTSSSCVTSSSSSSSITAPPVSSVETDFVVGGSAPTDNFLDIQQSFPNYSSASSFIQPFKDSIKQDVMLSSAVTSESATSFSSDMLSKQEGAVGTHPSKFPPTESGVKRRLSEDLDARRKASSFTTLQGPHTLGINPNSVLGLPQEAGRVRARSRSGDLNCKSFRSKSVDNPSGIVEEAYYSSQHYDDGFQHDHELFSRSDGSEVFRNPGHLPSPLKIKRKHRPAPLYIPPQFGIFQSRLRSPRVLGRDSQGHLTVERGRGHTPPPYTPPPMLSPFRSGSGLFCTLQTATPKSAPEWGKISLSRRGKLFSFISTYLKSFVVVLLLA